MADDYTPTTEEVRRGYAWENKFSGRDEFRAAFDRWLAEHDAALRAEWEAEQGTEVEYRVFDREGELWASTTSLDEARHYLAQEPSGLARIERAVWVPVEQEDES